MESFSYSPTFFLTVLFFWRPQVPSCTVPFMFWELPLDTFSIGLSVTNSISFPSSENVLIFPSLLKCSSAADRILAWQHCPLSTCKHSAISFWPLWFLMRNPLSSELFSPGGKVPFLLWLPSKRFLCLSFSKVRWYVLAWISFSLSCTGFVQLLTSVSLCLLSNLGRFQPSPSPLLVGRQWNGFRSRVPVPQAPEDVPFWPNLLLFRCLDR